MTDVDQLIKDLRSVAARITPYERLAPAESVERVFWFALVNYLYDAVKKLEHPE